MTKLEDPPDGHQPNELFRNARERLYGTREALAVAVNANLDPAFLVTPNDIGKIERGVVTYPRSPRRRAYRMALHVETDAEIGFFDSRRFPNSHQEDISDKYVADECIHREQLIPGARRSADVHEESGLRDVSADAGGDDAYGGFLGRVVATARRTSAYVMEAGAFVVPEFTIEQLTEDARDIARDFAARTASEAVTQTLDLHERVLATMPRTRRPAHQKQLLLLAGQTAVLLASASVDLGLWPTARQYARAAYGYGDMVGHVGVLTYARGMQATVAYWTGQTVEAVDFALAAVELAPDGVATVRANCVLARAWAHRGAPAEVGRALAAAENARQVDGVDDLHDVIGGEFGFSPAQQARCGSTAWLQVNRPAQATKAAETALRLIEQKRDDTSTALEAEARLDLACCQLLAGQPDGAYATLSRAEATLIPLWSTPTDQRRIGLFGRVDRLIRVLSAARWRTVPEARHTLQLAESFSAERPNRLALPPA